MAFSKHSASYLTYVVLLSSCLWIHCTGSKETRESEFRLRNKLLKNHSASTLPSHNKTKPLNVKLGLALRQILDVDERNQVLVTNIWFRQYWNDYILSWNVSEYQGVNELHLTRNDVWVPDIAIYNTASDHGMLYKRLDTQVVINNEGSAHWLTPVQVKTECTINVKYFPFDEQICKITFGSWTFHGGHVDLFPAAESADLTSFVPNTEWEVLEAPFTKDVKYYGCCPNPYPSLTVHIRIRRRALFYLSNLVIPCGVIALLASLAFFLPSNNGERISLVVTVLLSLTVYMLIVSETMPPTSDVVPLIGKFYISTMVLIALTLVAVCITLNCCEKDVKISRWLRKLLLDYLARLVFVTNTSQRMNAIGASVPHAFVVANGIEPKINSEEKNKAFAVNKDETNVPPDLANSNENPAIDEKGARTDFVMRDKDAYERRTGIKAEWKTASRVLDRIFFLVFILSFVIMSVIVFSEAPHISLS